MALFTQTSIGPSSSSTRLAAASSAAKSATPAASGNARAHFSHLRCGVLHALAVPRNQRHTEVGAGEFPYGRASDHLV
jgi:hypothetical protein